MLPTNTEINMIWKKQRPFKYQDQILARRIRERRFRRFIFELLFPVKLLIIWIIRILLNFADYLYLKTKKRTVFKKHGAHITEAKRSGVL
jgi:hypothetical protein